MDAALKRAIEFQRQGDLNAAIDVLEKSIRAGSKLPQSHYFLGVILENIGQLEQAEERLKQAVHLGPKHTEIWFSYGNILNKRDKVMEAMEAYEHCIGINPKHVQAWVNLALLAQRTDQMWKAVECSKKAVDLAPEEKKAWLAYIGSLGYARCFPEAEKAADEAEKHFPEDFEILHMKGNVITASGRVDEGYAVYLKALECNPNAPKVLNSIGSYISHNRNGLDAVPYHRKALEIDPKSAENQHGLGSAYLKAGYPGDAIQFYLKALQSGYKNADVLEGLLLSAHYLDSANNREILDLHLRWEEQYAQKFYPAEHPKLSAEVKAGKCPIRMGFLSPDFRNHSVTRFMTALLKHTDASGMEVFCYSDVKQVSDYSKSLERMGGNWFYSYTLTDTDLAERIRSDRMDVLVDLAGHTGNNRLFVFARHPAPVQISWLGYPNTTGLKTVAYRLSDAIADPVGIADELSTEKIIRMKGGFHCFEPPMNLPEVVSAPVLRDGYLTFGSFNNQAKINMLTVRRWVKLLQAIPDSKLILKNHQLGDERNKQHWARIFENEGIFAERIRFIGYCKELKDHYRTYEQIDIGLDTFPYNGTTTTCEALWMGVPVLTVRGDSQRARTGASLLTHTGLDDWIAENEEEWVAKALYWNENRALLNQIRLELRPRVEASPIGDAAGFAEKFYATIRDLVRPSA
jgi:protein O-GlcNAc transferase